MVEEGLLEGDEEVEGEHAKEDVAFDPTLVLVIDRPLGERGFHVAEGVFGAGEERVEVPIILSREIIAVGLDQIAAIELSGLGQFVFLEGGAELSGVGVDGEFVVAGDTGVAFLEPADRLGNLFGSFELAGGDPPVKFFEVGEQSALLFGADRAVFVAALLAAAQYLGRVATWVVSPSRWILISTRVLCCAGLRGEDWRWSSAKPSGSANSASQRVRSGCRLATR